MSSDGESDRRVPMRVSQGSAASVRQQGGSMAVNAKWGARARVGGAAQTGSPSTTPSVDRLSCPPKTLLADPTHTTTHLLKNLEPPLLAAECDASEI